MYTDHYVSPLGQEAGKDLKYKELRYFCDHCGWMAEKNSFMVPQCPECLKGLSYVYQDDKDG